MGSCFSKGGVKKDADDKTLDELDMRETRIDEFDDGFDQAATPLNTVAALNNVIVDAMDTVRSAALGLTGGYYQVVLKDGPLSLVVNEITETTEKGLSSSEVQGIDALSKPFKIAQGEIEKLNDLADTLDGSSVSVKGSRVIVSCKDRSGSAKLRAAASSVNNAVFAVKKATFKAAGKEAFTFADALGSAVTDIKKSGAEPKVVPNMDGVAEGNVTFDVEIDEKKLSPPQRRVWLAVAGPKGLTKDIMETAEALVNLNDDVEGAKEAIEGMPKDPAAIKDAASGAGLNPMQMIQAVKNLPLNVAEFGKAAGYPSQLLDTLKSTANQLKDSFAS